MGYSARELREGARGLVDLDMMRRAVVELEDAAEALARAALVPVELARELALRLGGLPAALAVVVAAAKFGGRRGKRR